MAFGSAISHRTEMCSVSIAAADTFTVLVVCGTLRAASACVYAPSGGSFAKIVSLFNRSKARY
jgi:hypothetical protein